MNAFFCRRKLQARITELEGTAEQAKNKASKLEKEKSKLTIEIRDISVQLDEVKF
jgi:predicted  nucleic acid-binding Zn-ribbon protein